MFLNGWTRPRMTRLQRTVIRVMAIYVFLLYICGDHLDYRFLVDHYDIRTLLEFNEQTNKVVYGALSRNELCFNSCKGNIEGLCRHPQCNCTVFQRGLLFKDET